LLVPMLGLAAFRWIWTRESQRQIQEIKVPVMTRTCLPSPETWSFKYKEILTENRRTAAVLELELEKERQRVLGYRRPLVSQSQQLLAERKQLQKEREEVEKEKRRAVQSGAAEEEWHQKAKTLLEELELQLVERQEAFCSPWLLPRERPDGDGEEPAPQGGPKDPVGAELGLEEDLRDIFSNDRNGKLMWLYLRYWQLQVTLQKHKRAEEALKGPSPMQSDLDTINSGQKLHTSTVR
uniref:Coiled-coil domain containing 127a n=1 Tax=Astyanax mexicanus TaxID=7994 RepID=A0A3B1K0V0_ASTMX